MAILKWREKDRVKEGLRRCKREEPRSRATKYKEASPAKKSWVENSSTFFFSNFPDNHREYDMFRVFQKWARVKEVFISRRLNRWGRRFEFVQLFPVSNEGRLEKHERLNAFRTENSRGVSPRGKQKEKEVWRENTRRTY